MFEIIERETQLRASQLKEGQGIKLSTIINDLNIDGMQLADERTIQFITTYQVYENNPQLAFDYMTDIWFNVHSELKRNYRFKFG